MCENGVSEPTSQLTCLHSQHSTAQHYTAQYNSAR